MNEEYALALTTKLGWNIFIIRAVLHREEIVRKWALFLQHCDANQAGKGGCAHSWTSPGSRRHLHPVGHLFSLEGIAEAEGRESGSSGEARQGKCASCWRKEKMKGKRRVKNKAEMSRKGGEGRQELMVLKLDGEWGQGELIRCSPLGRNSHWSCCQIWPGEGGELESRLESKWKGRGAGVPAGLQHPSCSERISPAPRGASPAALGTHHPAWNQCPVFMSLHRV